MIDIRSEKLLSLSQAARLVPPTRRGRATHPSTVLRWVHRGSRGRRLDAVRIGGNWFTSIEALARFAVHAPGGDDAGPAPDRAARTRGRRADEALDQLGL